MKTLWVSTVLLTVAVSVAGSSEVVTTGNLVREMIDMRRLGEFPDPFYKTVQFSSYDHRSNLPGGPEWFANSDGFGSEPIPNFEGVVKEPGADKIGEYLICDVEGPGAIVRTWSARMEGTIRLFLDGNQTPVFDGPSEEFLMRTYLPYAAAAGLDRAVFDGTFFQRNAAYCPIPFAKHCRMVWVGDIKTTHFYQVQIRLYDKAAQVVTFSPEDVKTYAKDLKYVSKVMADIDGAWPYVSKEKPVAFEGKIMPGERKALLSVDGPKAIERLTLSIKGEEKSRESLDKALRQTVMHIVCDDYPWGQVQSPVGDFFGAAPGVNPYTSVPFTVAPDGKMTCRYVMPFAKTLQITLENLGDQTVEIAGDALAMDYAWNDARSMHFRARWKVNHGITAAGNRVQDMPFLIAGGAGVYVGTTLMLLNPNPIPTSGGNWWGEGDEKVFSDGDVRPCIFGTGSEDYFNYAWSSEDIFIHPYCGQPRNDGPANMGFVTNYRWHIVDPLPFQQRLNFYIELFAHELTENISYARIAYHYGRPGLIDDHVVITKEDVRYVQRPEWTPSARRGAKNSFFYEVEDQIDGKGKIRKDEDNLWSGGKICRWFPKDPGDEVRVKFPIKADGKYTVRLATARDNQSGVISILVDGKPCGFGGETGKIDLFDPYRTLLRAVESGPVELAKGNHEMTIRFEGCSKEVKEPSLGLDFVWIQSR